MIQRRLFADDDDDPRDAPHAFARRSDPTTSHDAADSVEHIRASQAEIHRLLHDFGPCHDEHLIRLVHDHGRFPMSVSGIRTRRSELVTKGLVRDSGQRVLTASGRRSIVWEITPDTNGNHAFDDKRYAGPDQPNDERKP